MVKASSTGINFVDKDAKYSSGTKFPGIKYPAPAVKAGKAGLIMEAWGCWFWPSLGIGRGELMGEFLIQPEIDLIIHFWNTNKWM